MMLLHLIQLQHKETLLWLVSVLASHLYFHPNIRYSEHNCILQTQLRVPESQICCRIKSLTHLDATKLSIHKHKQRLPPIRQSFAPHPLWPLRPPPHCVPPSASWNELHFLINKGSPCTGRKWHRNHLQTGREGRLINGAHINTSGWSSGSEGRDPG